MRYKDGILCGRCVDSLSADMLFKMFTRLKLRLASATHNFKRVKITITFCLILDQTFANLDV